MLLAVLISLSAATTSPAESEIEPICQNPAVIVVRTPATTGAIHPLTAEPRAQHLKAVVREIDGCNRPVTINMSAGMRR